MKYICIAFGTPLCGSIPDPRFTRSSPLDNKITYWCTSCGERLIKLADLIKKEVATNERDHGE